MTWSEMTQTNPISSKVHYHIVILYIYFNVFAILENKPIKSLRSNPMEETIEDELHVPESMQTFIYNKMSKILENQYEFVDIPVTKEKTKFKCKESVRLFKNASPIVNITAEMTAKNASAQNRPKPFKRKLENDCNHEEKLQASIISIEEITRETNLWKKRKSKHLYEYKEINSKHYLREPDTEFTKLRNKNNWSENKIARK